MTSELKPCPFCGGEPRITWINWTEISATSGIFTLEADHTEGCFIRRMNGMNFEGQMIGSNKETLIEVWNKRVEQPNTK